MSVTNNNLEDGATFTRSFDKAEEETKPVSQSFNTSFDKAKARWVTVEPVVFLAFMGSGTFSTIRSEYLQKYFAREYNYTYPTNSSCVIANTSDPDYIIEQQIQADAANWSLYLSICSFLPLIFTAILLGKWSDNAGRKMAIALPVIGSFIQSLVYAIVIAADLPMPILFAGELAYGLLGGSPLLVSIALAYIADITTMAQRTFRVVIVETSIVVPIGVAQLVMGYLIEAKGFMPTFYLILASQLVAFTYICIPGILYESIQFKHEEGGGLSSRMLQLFHGIIDLFTSNVDNRRWRLLLINAIFFPIILIIYGYTSIITLFAIGQPFCWSSVLVGIYMGISLALFSVSNVVGSKLLGMCLQDIWLLHIALISSIASMITLALAQDTIVIFLSSAVGCIRVLSIAMARSMASKCVSANEQGVTFSILASLDSIALFLGPLLFQLLYSINVLHGNPGVPFFAAAGLGVVAETLTVILHCGFLTRRSSYVKVN